VSTYFRTRQSFKKQNHFIVNYSLLPNPTDTASLKTNLESFKNLYNTLLEEPTGEAGYGSEEIIQLLEDNGIDAYVKDSCLRG